MRETALGIVRIVNANMMRAIRVVSIERGHDPRAFTLMPFGGAGALHAVEIARELGIRGILVPPAPGILCAEGVVAAELEESFVATCRVPLDGDLAPVAAAFSRLIDAARQWHARERQAGAEERQDIAVDMRYVGQNFELAIPVPQGAGASARRLAEARVPRGASAQIRPPRSRGRRRGRQCAAERAQGARWRGGRRRRIQAVRAWRRMRAARGPCGSPRNGRRTPGSSRVTR